MNKLKPAGWHRVHLNVDACKHIKRGELPQVAVVQIEKTTPAPIHVPKLQRYGVCGFCLGVLRGTMLSIDVPERDAMAFGPKLCKRCGQPMNVRATGDEHNACAISGEP